MFKNYNKDRIIKKVKLDNNKVEQTKYKIKILQLVTFAIRQLVMN